MAPTVAGRWLGVVGAVLATAFLVLMAVSGRVQESAQFVRFVPAGVLGDLPARIGRVELSGHGGRWQFSRGASGWQFERDHRPVAASLASRLDNGIKFLHVSAPVRVLSRQEWSEQGYGEFGLNQPAVAAILFENDRRALAVAFGSTNPQKVLQYMRIDGRDEVYLMSRFVGHEWEEILNEVGR